MEGISEEMLAEFRQAFTVIDKDCSGSISPQNLKEVMQANGDNVTDEEVQSMISEADLDGTGKVSFTEFARLMKKRMERQKILEAFQSIDRDGSGKVSVEELREIMKMAEDQMSGEEVDAMIKAADTDGDGQVNYQEFMKVMGGQ